jgi:hypothetical protein
MLATDVAARGLGRQDGWLLCELCITCAAVLHCAVVMRHAACWHCPCASTSFTHASWHARDVPYESLVAGRVGRVAVLSAGLVWGRGCKCGAALLAALHAVAAIAGLCGLCLPWRAATHSYSSSAVLTNNAAQTHEQLDQRACFAEFGTSLAWRGSSLLCSCRATQPFGAAAASRQGQVRGALSASCLFSLLQSALQHTCVVVLHTMACACRVVLLFAAMLRLWRPSFAAVAYNGELSCSCCSARGCCVSCSLLWQLCTGSSH